MSAKTQSVSIPWTDLKACFLDVSTSGRWPTSQPCGMSHAREWASENPSARKVQWAGGTAAQTRDWIENGYHAPEFTLNPIEIAPRRRKRAAWSEEDGDADVGRIYGGADDFYLSRALRESRPGLEIDVNVSFSAFVNASIPQAYGAWIAGLIGGLEAQGHDLAVTVGYHARGMWGGTAENSVPIIVKRANEVSDFASWSALFAPTGFRYLLMRMAVNMGGDLLGRTTARGHGIPIGHAWTVEQADGRVSISCNRGERGTPESVTAKLTAAAQQAGLI